MDAIIVLKATISKIPKGDENALREWCEEHDISYLGDGLKHGWCSRLSEYIRDSDCLVQLDDYDAEFFAQMEDIVTT